MAKAKSLVKTKVKKKTWHTVNAPRMFNNVKLGEMYLQNKDQALGRIIKYNLADMTRNMKNQNSYITFRIKENQDKKLTSEVIGYNLTKTSIKRFVRRKNSRLDESFVLTTSDNKKIRLKTIAITVFKISNTIATALRKEQHKALQEQIEKLNFGNLLDKIISRKIQLETKKRTSTIVPIKLFEIKSMALETARGETQEGAEEITPEIKKEEIKKEA